MKHVTYSKYLVNIFEPCEYHFKIQVYVGRVSRIFFLFLYLLFMHVSRKSREFQYLLCCRGVFLRKLLNFWKLSWRTFSWDAKVCSSNILDGTQYKQLQNVIFSNLFFLFLYASSYMTKSPMTAQNNEVMKSVFLQNFPDWKIWYKNKYIHWTLCKMFLS